MEYYTISLKASYYVNVAFAHLGDRKRIFLTALIARFDPFNLVHSLAVPELA